MQRRTHNSFYPWRGGGRALVALLGAISVSSVAQAGEANAAPEVRSESVAEPGSKVKWGRAEAVYAQSIEQVRAIVRDYDRYAEFLPHFEKSKVLSQRGAMALVYMQAKVGHGAVTVWAQLRMKAETDPEGREVIEARMMKGNVNQMAARWELTPLPDGRTRVVFRMLMDPKLPLPSGFVSSENEKATRKTLIALADRLSQPRAAGSR